MSRPYLLTKPDGTKQWFLNYNELHRLDGPAVIMPDGTTKWFRNGNCHREDGPAIESPDGYYAWYYNNILHREDGPAVEYQDGTKFWHYHGAYHRVGGPAVYYGSVWRNDKTYRWYLYGVEMEKENYYRVLRTCRRAVEKFKVPLRRKYISALKETNTCNEVFLYNIIASYMI
jgi:hypothetical protein